MSENRAQGTDMPAVLRAKWSFCRQRESSPNMKSMGTYLLVRLPRMMEYWYLYLYLYLADDGWQD